MLKFDVTEEFKTLVDYFEKSGGDPDVFKNSNVSTLLINGNKVLAKNVSEGVHVETIEMEEGVEVYITIDDDVQMKNPVHMCFGLLHKKGTQKIISHYKIGKRVKVSFLAHCIFPNPEHIVHQMDADIYIGDESSLFYNEIHYHGNEGTIDVLPKGKIKVGRGGKYFSEFKLVEGKVGNFDMDYVVDVDDNGVAELSTKLYGKQDDTIKVKESIYLNGISSKGIAKTRIVNTDSSKSEVLGEVIGNGDYSRGHVDCTEIIEGNNASASAVPLVKVTNPKAKVTHEAAIGSVDKNQIETLMARGLTENEAIDIIIKGLLK